MTWLIIIYDTNPVKLTFFCPPPNGYTAYKTIPSGITVLPLLLNLLYEAPVFYKIFVPCPEPAFNNYRCQPFQFL